MSSPVACCWNSRTLSVKPAPMHALLPSPCEPRHGSNKVASVNCRNGKCVAHARAVQTCSTGRPRPSTANCVRPGTSRPGGAAKMRHTSICARLGYIIVARNWRTARHRGELDLIGWERNVLCFIEVKTRTSRDVKPAEAAVDRGKRLPDRAHGPRVPAALASGNSRPLRCGFRLPRTGPQSRGPSLQERLFMA